MATVLLSAQAPKVWDDLVSRDVLSVIAAVLEKAVRGAPDAEIADMLELVRNVSPSTSTGPDIERLHAYLNTLAQAIRDRGVSERGLNLLIDTTHDLSSTLTLQDLLRTIVSRARSLVGANIAWLTLLDDDQDTLRTVTAEGHIYPATSEMTARIGYGAVSLTVSSKSFFDTQDYLADQRFRHSTELDQIFRAESIVSLAGFPILLENKLQGVLFVADRYHRKLSAREISILGSFASHAGVAMRNARAFTRVSEALADAERNRTALHRPHSSRRRFGRGARRIDVAVGQGHRVAAVHSANGRSDRRRHHSLR